MSRLAHNLRPQGPCNRTFYDRISGVYDFIADASEHKARAAGEELLGVQNGEHVLELGFGTGSSLLHLAHCVGAEGKAEGLDISPGMLEVAGKKLERAGVAARVFLRLGDGRELPYESETFDAVFASFTLELFELDDIPRVLAEIHRVLHSRGRFAVVSMASMAAGQHPSLIENTYVWMHRHFPHIVDCQPINAARFLEEAGFEIVKRVDLEIWSMPVAVLLGRRS